MRNAPAGSPNPKVDPARCAWPSDRVHLGHQAGRIADRRPPLLDMRQMIERQLAASRPRCSIFDPSLDHRTPTFPAALERQTRPAAGNPPRDLRGATWTAVPSSTCCAAFSPQHDPSNPARPSIGGGSLASGSADAPAHRGRCGGSVGHGGVSLDCLPWSMRSCAQSGRGAMLPAYNARYSSGPSHVPVACRPVKRRK